MAISIRFYNTLINGASIRFKAQMAERWILSLVYDIESSCILLTAALEKRQVFLLSVFVCKLHMCQFTPNDTSETTDNDAAAYETSAPAAATTKTTHATTYRAIPLNAALRDNHADISHERARATHMPPPCWYDTRTYRLRTGNGVLMLSWCLYGVVYLCYRYEDVIMFSRLEREKET